MSGSTFAIIVGRRRIEFVAGLAFDDIFMVIGNDLPVCFAGVAQTALTREMVLGGLVNMARFTGGHANMIELVGFPTVNQVTIGAFTFKVVSWWFVAFTAYRGTAGVVCGGMTGFASNIMAPAQREEAVVYIL